MHLPPAIIRHPLGTLLMTTLSDPTEDGFRAWEPDNNETIVVRRGAELQHQLRIQRTSWPLDCQTRFMFAVIHVYRYRLLPSYSALAIRMKRRSSETHIRQNEGSQVEGAESKRDAFIPRLIWSVVLYSEVFGSEWFRNHNTSNLCYRKTKSRI